MANSAVADSVVLGDADDASYDGNDSEDGMDDEDARRANWGLELCAEDSEVV